MKKLLLVLAILPTVTFAEEQNDFCSDMFTLAKNIMEIRQRNVAMPAVVNAIRQTDSGEKFLNLAIAMVKDAYKQPLYSTQENKDRTATEFANDIYLACIQEVEK